MQIISNETAKPKSKMYDSLLASASEKHVCRASCRSTGHIYYLPVQCSTCTGTGTRYPVQYQYCAVCSSAQGPMNWSRRLTVPTGTSTTACVPRYYCTSGTHRYVPVNRYQVPRYGVRYQYFSVQYTYCTGTSTVPVHPSDNRCAIERKSCVNLKYLVNLGPFKGCFIRKSHVFHARPPCFPAISSNLDFSHISTAM